MGTWRCKLLMRQVMPKVTSRKLVRVKALIALVSFWILRYLGLMDLVAIPSLREQSVTGGCCRQPGSTGSPALRFLKRASPTNYTSITWGLSKVQVPGPQPRPWE